MAQVRHHTERTERQYALKDKAGELGWPETMIRILDADLGVSGAQIAGREDFKILVADVSMGKVGAVFALEASRSGQFPRSTFVEFETFRQRGSAYGVVHRFNGLSTKLSYARDGTRRSTRQTAWWRRPWNSAGTRRWRTWKSSGWIRLRHKIPAPQLKRPEELTVNETAEKFGVSPNVVYYWIEQGVVDARKVNNRSPWGIRISPQKEGELRHWVSHSTKIQKIRAQQSPTLTVRGAL